MKLRNVMLRWYGWRWDRQARLLRRRQEKQRKFDEKYGRKFGPGLSL